MNYNKYDKLILEYSNNVGVDKKENLEKLIKLKDEIIKLNDTYNEKLELELKLKENYLDDKIKKFKNLILLYRNKKNLIQYPYSLIRLNNDYKEFHNLNNTLIINIDENLQTLFDYHILRNDLENKINLYENKDKKSVINDLHIVKEWHNVLIEREKLKITNLLNDTSYEVSNNNKKNNLVNKFNTKINELNNNLQKSDNEIEILTKSKNNCNIEESIKEIKLDNLLKKKNITIKEIQYLKENHHKELKNLDDLYIEYIKNRKREATKLNQKILNIQKNNETELQNIIDANNLLIQNEKNDKENYNKNLNDILDIKEKIKNLSYEISNSKQELEYNYELSTNMKTKIKLKELYVVKNYKQVYKYYNDIINEKEEEIKNIQLELKNLKNVNIDVEKNLRIKIIDNLIENIC